ncbi:hypothetical protein DND58_14290 [Pseudomonas syringae pv. pisi]|nr:hypothetical protein DND62_12075 [Pseudomonas syringae pv. pisi]PYD30984.1 hypothetical protein DND58_14290 [Pseudomonas syringae pv. pisi]PYD34506.1 hypothetical protein DND67_08095 [Pseudomonas syringae pv. pisi]
MMKGSTMSLATQSLFALPVPTENWSTTSGEASPPPARTTSNVGAVLALKFSPPTPNHNSKHTDFDNLLAELEADPRNAQDMADAGAWASDFLYPGEAETLRTARLRKGLSQKQLASLIGTSQPHIANLEKSGNDVMLSTAVKLCAALDIEFGCLPGMIDRQRSINSQKELK